jgi:hypothetical protein
VNFLPQRIEIIQSIGGGIWSLELTMYQQCLPWNLFSHELTWVKLSCTKVSHMKTRKIPKAKFPQGILDFSPGYLWWEAKEYILLVDSFGESKWYHDVDWETFEAVNDSIEFDPVYDAVL